jgi:hypothetical protein
MGKNKHVFQFRITLAEVEPTVWRRILVPGSYTFWDLHVAIQDSMGWLDCHLHLFKIKRPHKHKPTEIGIWFETEFEDEAPPLVAWEEDIEEYFVEPGRAAEYLYDFGDGWRHEILLEGVLMREKGTRYPQCIAGARTCPPEDCGGTWGFEKFRRIMADPSHEEYEDMLSWYGKPFDPDGFSPDQVRFDNPQKRWRAAFKSRG